jgi:hypothetical protein
MILRLRLLRVNLGGVNLDDSPVLGITLLAAANAEVDERREDDMA